MVALRVHQIKAAGTSAGFTLLIHHPFFDDAWQLCLCAGAVTKPSTQKRLAQALESNELPKLMDLRAALNVTLTSQFPQMRALGSAMGSSDATQLECSRAVQRNVMIDGLKVRRLPVHTCRALCTPS